jgi:hypothetical protein
MSIFIGINLADSSVLVPEKSFEATFQKPVFKINF